jgi:hypothetical protein
MDHESQIELWSPNLTTFCFVGFGTDRLRCQEAMKTASRENPKRWAIVPSNRAHGAVDQNNSRSIQWAEKQEKFQPKEMCFFLTSTFIELIRTYPIVESCRACEGRVSQRINCAEKLSRSSRSYADQVSAPLPQYFLMELILPARLSSCLGDDLKASERDATASPGRGRRFRRYFGRGQRAQSRREKYCSTQTPGRSSIGALPSNRRVVRNDSARL